MIIWLALAACSAPVRSPRAEQTISIDDATFHVRADGNVDVTITRTFEDNRGSGRAVLVGTDLDDARRSPHLRLARARAWLDVARAVVAAPRLAYQAAHRGLDELGTEYAKRGIIDDTSNFVLMARSEIDTNPTHAASLVVRVLTTRVRLYIQRYHAQVQ